MKPIDLMELLDELPEEDIAEELDYQPIPKRRTFLVSKPFLAGASTAACLLLIVGLGVGVWSRQQKIETRPPQETHTTTVIQTETITETIAQVTTESQTTGKQTEPTTRMTETTATLPEVIASYTTAIQTSVMTAAMPTTEQTFPLTTVQTTAVAMTEPTVPLTTALTYAPSYETWSPIITETKLIPSTSTFETTAATSDTMIESTTEVTPSILPGFVVEEAPYNKVHISLVHDVSPSPDERKHYALSGMNAKTKEFLEMQAPFAKEYYYSIIFDDNTDPIVIAQLSRDSFSVLCNQDSTLIPAKVLDYPAFWVTGGDKLLLYWDDGAYTFMASVDAYSDQQMQEVMLEVASKFSPIDE